MKQSKRVSDVETQYIQGTLIIRDTAQYNSEPSRITVFLIFFNDTLAPQTPGLTPPNSDSCKEVEQDDNDLVKRDNPEYFRH